MGFRLFNVVEKSGDAPSVSLDTINRNFKEVYEANVDKFLEILSLNSALVWQPLL